MIQDDDVPLCIMPDFDDTLQRLSDLFMAYKICRRRTCRWHESCQGGFGPPKYLAISNLRSLISNRIFNNEAERCPQPLRYHVSAGWPGISAQ